MLIKDLYNALTDLLYPSFCLLCAHASNRPGLCEECIDTFKKIEAPCCPICGKVFLSLTDSDHVCGACITNPPPFEAAASLFHFSVALTDAIHLFKYHNKTFLAPVFGDLLSMHKMCQNSFDLIVPVPLHPARLRERGFNQSRLLGQRIAQKKAFAENPYILDRVVATAPQVGKNSAQRKLNVKGAFGIRKGACVKGRRILLIDDVYTTGATVRECAKTLKKKGATHVSVLTLSRVADA